MIGPSSSHTAGAVRIGKIAGQLCGYKPKVICVYFHGSLASTYLTHKTDSAIIAGIIGMDVDDKGIKNSIEKATNEGIEIYFDKIQLHDVHPNTMVISIKDRLNEEYIVRAATIGGGNILIEQINNYKTNINGKKDCIVGLTTYKNKDEFRQAIESESDSLFRIECFSEIDNGNAFTLIGVTALKNEFFEKIKTIKQIKEALLIKSILPYSVSEKPFFHSCKELVEKAMADNCEISDIVIDFEAETSDRTREQVFEQMMKIFYDMKESINTGITFENQLLGNIFKGNAAKLEKYFKSGRSICSPALTKMIRNALAVMEVNGSMGRVVACPTAGSAGALPAVLVTISEENNISEHDVVQSMFTAAGIGIIIAENATISGAVGGCQAECGVASAMAAAAVTEIFGGNYHQILSAVSLALGNILGLVCDPVAGMVEIPCIQRNTIAATNAITAAEMALAGVDSIIPADEMISAMEEVGRLMDSSLKDTLGAGISNTPTARRIEAIKKLNK